MSTSGTGNGLGNETVDVVIVGAGGFGREVFWLLQAAEAAGDHRLRFVGFVDDGEPELERLDRLGAPLLGPVASIRDHPYTYLLGVGNGSTREELDARVARYGRDPTHAIHPTAAIGPDVTWSPGFVACANTSITTNVRIGRHVHINLNATVGHDCTIGDYVTVNPGVNISGDVSIGERAMLGTGAAVIQGVTIGADATIGAGAVVIGDVLPGVTVVGVPARPIRR